MKKKLNRNALLLTMLMMVAGHVWGTTTFVKVTSTDDLVAGEKYILAATTTINNNLYTYVALAWDNNQLTSTKEGFTVSGNTITLTTASPMEFTLGTASSYYTLLMSEGYLGYAHNSSSTTDLEIASNSNNSKERWVFSYDSNKTSFVLVSAELNSRFLSLTDVKNNDAPAYFKAYSYSSGAIKSNPIANLYRKVESGTESLTLSPACTDGTNYYGTFSSTHAFVVPSGLTMSAVGVDGEGSLVVIDYAAGDVVKANTGVMVSSTTSGEHTVALSTEAGTEIAGNLLKASGDGLTATQMTNANAAGCRFYRLTMHNGSDLGFWWGAGDGAAFALDAHKAYLAVPEAQAARAGFSFGGDDGTGIVEVQAMSSSDRQHVYDLSGRRTSNTTKGISVVGGRKVLRR